MMSLVMRLWKRMAIFFVAIFLTLMVTASAEDEVPQLLDSPASVETADELELDGFDELLSEGEASGQLDVPKFSNEDGVEPDLLGLPNLDEEISGDEKRDVAEAGEKLSSPKVEPALKVEDFALDDDESLDLLGAEEDKDGRLASLPKGDPSVANSITNLEFRMDAGLSKIYVSSEHPLVCQEVKNQGMNQVVYYFKNTTVPKKLSRAFDTTEFSSPVALFTLIQVPGESPPTAKLIVQLRELKTPMTTMVDNSFVISFPAASGTDLPRLAIDKDKELLPTEQNIYSGDQTYTGRIVRRLEIKDSEVQDVLRLIARTSGFNIVVGDDVSGKVGTLSLENIPWDQAFTLVLQMKQLGYIKQGNVIRVATLSNLQKEKQESEANELAKVRVAPLKTVIVPVSYAKAADLAERGKSFLTPRGNIDTDAHSNMVIVKDIDSVVAKLQKLFKVLDTQPPRVSISGKFVEMSSNFSWGFGVSPIAFSGKTSGLNLSQTIESSTANNANVTSVIQAADFANFRANLTLGEQEDSVRVLSNPSTSVVANQTAVVKQTLSFNNLLTSVTAGGAAQQIIQTITSDTSLNVTPIVAGDGTIFLTVKLTNEIPRPSGDTVNIDSRNISTQILLQNGDTAVLGSIFSHESTFGGSGVPFFRRIPIIGWLLGNQTFSERKSEIFVFLTARIMNPEEAFKRTL